MSKETAPGPEISPELRALLENVAAGRIDPQEAARLLEEASGGWPSADVPAPDSAETPTLLRIDLAATTLTLVADPEVATVSVTGPHALSREGRTLTLTPPPWTGPEEGTYAVRPPQSSSHATWQRVADWLGRWGRGDLTVRVNPDLDVAVSMTAGEVKAVGGVRLRTVRIGAGSLDVEGQTAPLDVSVTAGAAVVRGEPTYGTWRASVTGGSLRIVLAPTSSARVRVFSRLAEVVGVGETGERILGAGAAEFDISATAADVVVAEGAGVRS